MIEQCYGVVWELKKDEILKEVFFEVEVCELDFEG